MKKYKYSLETILLYLENSLSTEKNDEISFYVSQNQQFSDYLIKIIKINSRINYVHNEISFMKQGGMFICMVYGLLKLDDKKMLTFRGNTESCLYRCLFKDLVLLLVKNVDEIWTLVVEKTKASDHFNFSLINHHLQCICDHLELPRTTIELMSGATYQLFYYNDDEMDNVSIVIP